MEGTARSCSQMWVCCSFCTCCQRKSAKFVPIDKSAPPPICSSSDLSAPFQTFSRPRGVLRPTLVDPEPSSSAPGSALGSKKETDLEPYVIVFHLQKKKKRDQEDLHLQMPEKTWQSQKSTARKTQAIAVFMSYWPFLLDLIIQSW